MIARLITEEEAEAMNLPQGNTTAKALHHRRCLSRGENPGAAQHLCALAPNHEGVHVCYNNDKPHAYWVRDED